MPTETAKERIVKVVASQPDDATYDEILKELALANMVDHGLEDIRTDRLVSNNEMARRISTWQR